jgi:hypothetical protein
LQLHQAAAAATALNSSSSSSSTAAMWLLLMSRGLVISGQQFIKQADMLEALKDVSSSSEDGDDADSDADSADLSADSDADSASGSIAGSAKGTVDSISESEAGDAAEGSANGSIPTYHDTTDCNCAHCRAKPTFNLLHGIQDTVAWLVEQLQLLQLPLLQLPARSTSKLLAAAAVAAAACNSEAAAADGDVQASSSSSPGASTAGSTSLLQELLQQAEQIQHSASAVDNEPNNACRRQLGQQLVAFGEALCAVRPSKLCCNDSRCSSLACLSEAELVGGKECVCAR